MTNVATNNEQLLRDFILENYLFTDDQSKLNNADSFLDTGILDSMGILELIYFLDEELSIKVEPNEMIPTNLDSINNLLAFIEKKQA
ncbi:acyl carrier protein [Aliikangiella coralliicola]|uniref:Acyl carrier protein n=1 Tax=Aliikangiella coralliicola TaxID=2592383 RepID=A0A545UHH2_9GAMM|nr:acyl carrier protein [Aliikangiella coralliicola]TQV88910.1 acyl carrier protein [Aliikangiella coralliicola]